MYPAAVGSGGRRMPRASGQSAVMIVWAAAGLHYLAARKYFRAGE